VSDALTPPERDRLAIEHLGLVRALARRNFARTALDLSDLEAAGAIGLIEASRRFDPARGLKFATLAGHRIVGAMRDELRRGGPFTRHEMPAARTGALVRHLVPLEAAESVAQAQDAHDEIAARRLRALIRRLPPRMGKVLVWRYWRGLNQAQIAAHLNLTPGRISQIEAKAIARLRAALRESGQ
jgi:RNA polymerase sigma factor for flagellar operon FliA